jgi:hypothetical protein
MKGGWPTLPRSASTLAVPSTNAVGVTQVSPARKRWEPNPKRAVFLSADSSPSLPSPGVPFLRYLVRWRNISRLVYSRATSSAQSNS